MVDMDLMVDTHLDMDIVDTEDMATTVKDLLMLWLRLNLHMVDMDLMVDTHLDMAMEAMEDMVIMAKDLPML